jgi:phosphoribosylformylglycinamidine (FGAM) synthase-like enzyme/phosphoribosylformylglycinamidine (FGAM) synthase-like amidotransferase family enzyme
MNRIFVEKKPGHDAEASHLLHDLRESLGLPGLESLRVIQRYEVAGLSESEFAAAVATILSEPQVDLVSPTLSTGPDEHPFAVEYLPGQFDQRADSAAQCIQILTGKEKPEVHSAKILIPRGNLAAEEIAAIKQYIINTVDSHEIPVAAVCKRQDPHIPADVRILNGFTAADPSSIRTEFSLAMSVEDIAFCQAYFRDQENRDPSITELKMLDTYWSDHCRHTTFLTKIEDVTFDDPDGPVARAWQTYQSVRTQLGRGDKPVTLMDIALIGMRELRASGELDNLEVSDEVNAASIVVPVEISNLKSQISNSTTEEWLVMFKNETHNHPTEIEPFGGAATCLGGCIRDPLSGRSYVYQAMRVTGAGNPNTPFSETLPGKLPQKKICQVAAHGYSSYGNQIGLATGQVAEVYHPGYVAKRMEIGAVVAAAPRANVFRGTPAPGDVILLIGGRTGRDGVGGATGSSKEHDDSALENSAEVQKGDAPTERKIQRLFRNPELTRKIKICNDFGAGGVSVAIGEIAPSLVIDLDAIPKKYDGLDGTELAISESQERMAVCVDPKEIDYFIAEADKENLECVKVADVTDSGRLVMTWRGKTIVDLSRAFLDTNGVQQSARVHVAQASCAPSPPILTPSVSSNHEHTTTLLERSASQGFASRLGGNCKTVLDILTRVHRASQKAGIPEPKNRQERIKLERALRTIEERELRRASSLILNAAGFNQNWVRQGKISGAEQRVYFEEQECSVIKANNGNFHGNWLQYLERLHLHQFLFPETAYTFMGLLVEDSEISMVVRQPFAKASNDVAGATRDEVEVWMREHFGAFRYKNDDYYLPQLDLLIEDLHDENVLVSENRKALLVIDPVIYVRPADVPIPVPVARASCPPASSTDHCPLLTNHLRSLNISSQRGLGEMFDGSVGAGTVLWPFGGKHQVTPPDAMVAKLPLLDGDTDVCTHMAWGFDPYLSEQSPFHGAAYAVTESVCKIVASGARLSDIRLTLQEYFPKLGNDPRRWGLPFAALLGAFHAQHSLRLAAIGGKDSMSGSFNELDVPPTLVSFALAPGKASLALSPEFKKPGSTVSLVTIPRDADHLPDFESLKQTAEVLHQLNREGKLLSLHHIGRAGLAAALAKMAFGNRIGFSSRSVGVPTTSLFTEAYFTFLLEHTETLPSSLNAQPIGHTTPEPTLTLDAQPHNLTDLQAAWESTLEPIYPTRPETGSEIVDSRSKMAGVPLHSSSTAHCSLITRHSKPKVLIPAFPGTNSEYDSAKAFREAGAEAEILVFRNLSARHIEESLTALAGKIRQCQILMFPGGFSAGDEPDGSAKFIATIIRSPRVADAIMDLLKNRDGLILGICNGFQALIKTGLVPYGEIVAGTSSPSPSGGHPVPHPSARPTLVHNTIGRHLSRYAHTRVTSTLSPWLSHSQVGDIHTIPLSHGEGRFFASPEIIARLAAAGQIATQYCDENGVPSMDIAHNPNGSLGAIEGITSPCGRVFGKMGHTERAGSHVAKNIPGNKYQPLFKAGVGYFNA